MFKVAGNKDMHRTLNGFDFGHINITWPWTIGFLFGNYSHYVDEFTCWLSGERFLPFWLLVLIDNEKSTPEMNSC